MSALGDNPDGICSLRAFPLLTDAVEKVGSTALARNNRIPGDDFLNRPCALSGRLESMLLRDPPQNRFSTASTHTGHVDRPKEHLKDRHRLDSSGGISATRG